MRKLNFKSLAEEKNNNLSLLKWFVLSTCLFLALRNHALFGMYAYVYLTKLYFINVNTKYYLINFFKVNKSRIHHQKKTGTKIQKMKQGNSPDHQK